MRIKKQNYNFAYCFYGCETWSLILREERRLWVSKNRVVKRIFGPKRDEVIGEWRRLRHEDIYDLYFSPYIMRVIKSRRMRWAGHVANMARVEVQILVGKPHGKRPLGKPKLGWMLLKCIFKKWGEGNGLN
jgi:hypothetical protein